MSFHISVDARGEGKGTRSVFSFPGKSDALKSFNGHGKASNKPEGHLRVTLLEIPKRDGGRAELLLQVV